MSDECPICDAEYRDAAENIALRKTAEHIQEKARVDDTHAEWVDEHTDDGTREEILDALESHSAPSH